mmetsp:Transcript_90198/g.254470  ORF Transcript_90198/g.254470 Transcript_90198/m.254470 type:complete len:219 (+) Transcript_90198:288-944(+)
MIGAVVVHAPNHDARINASAGIGAEAVWPGATETNAASPCAFCEEPPWGTQGRRTLFWWFRNLMQLPIRIGVRVLVAHIEELPHRRPGPFRLKRLQRLPQTEFGTVGCGDLELVTLAVLATVFAGDLHYVEMVVRPVDKLERHRVHLAEREVGNNPLVGHEVEIEHVLNVLKVVLLRCHHHLAVIKPWAQSLEASGMAHIDFFRRRQGHVADADENWH